MPRESSQLPCAWKGTGALPVGPGCSEEKLGSHKNTLNPPGGTARLLKSCAVLCPPLPMAEDFQRVLKMPLSCVFCKLTAILKQNIKCLDWVLTNDIFSIILAKEKRTNLQCVNVKNSSENVSKNRERKRGDVCKFKKGSFKSLQKE